MKSSEKKNQKKRGVTKKKSTWLFFLRFYLKPEGEKDQIAPLSPYALQEH